MGQASARAIRLADYYRLGRKAKGGHVGRVVWHEALPQSLGAYCLDPASNARRKMGVDSSL